jgi:curved DNA-binding protein CbpA
MPDPDDDPFELLGLPPTFELDAESLRRTVRRRIAARHPDRISDPLLRDEAERDVARLNAARTLLEDDERRANLLLDRLGGPSAADDRSLPPTFLIEILQVREDMEQALAGGDPAERTRVESWARSERTRLKSSVGDLLSRMADGESLGAEIRTELNVWRYIERMIEQLDPAGLDPFATPGDR